MQNITIAFRQSYVILWINAQLSIVYKSELWYIRPTLIFSRVRVFHLEMLKEGTWLHSFVFRPAWMSKAKFVRLIISFLSTLAYVCVSHFSVVLTRPKKFKNADISHPHFWKSKCALLRRTKLYHWTIFSHSLSMQL